MKTQTGEPAPMFASNEKALLASRALYSRYLSSSDKVSNSGGQHVDDLKALVGKSEYDQEVSAARIYSREGIQTSGRSVLRKFLLQKVDRKTGYIAAYACVDIADVEVIDKHGSNVTPKQRSPRSTFRPTFKIISGQLRIETNEKWSGASVC